MNRQKGEFAIGFIGDDKTEAWLTTKVDFEADGDKLVSLIHHNLNLIFHCDRLQEEIKKITDWKPKSGRQQSDNE